MIPTPPTKTRCGLDSPELPPLERGEQTMVVWHSVLGPRRQWWRRAPRPYLSIVKRVTALRGRPN